MAVTGETCRWCEQEGTRTLGDYRIFDGHKPEHPCAQHLETAVITLLAGAAEQQVTVKRWNRL